MLWNKSFLSIKRLSSYLFKFHIYSNIVEKYVLYQLNYLSFLGNKL